MMNYFLLAISAVLGGTRSLLTKTIKKDGENNSDTLLRNAIAFFIAFIVITAIGAWESGGWNNVPVFMALCYAVFTLGAQVSLMMAVNTGSVAVSSLFYSCGFIIPTVFGIIYYNEGFTALSVIGIIFIIFSFVLSVKKEENSRFNLKWLLSALSGTVCSGIVGIIQKLFMKECVNSSLNIFLIVAFGFTFIIGLSVTACFKVYENKKGIPERISDKGKDIKSLTPIYIVISLALGVILGFSNKLNTFLSGEFPSVISFPVINGGTIVFSALLSAIFLKEKLTIKQKIGLGIGIIAIVITATGKI